MTARAPRCIISAGGSQISPMTCVLHQTTHQSADTFTATLALNAPPGPAFWADEAPIECEVLGSNDGAGFVSMFTGEIDHIEETFHDGIVSISGRDKTQKLLDKKTNEAWRNKSEADIIKELAGRVGLSAEISGGQTKAGLEYKDEHNRISYLDNYHNVIIRLARQMGCVAFVKGDRLIVQPVNEKNGSDFNLFYSPPSRANFAQGNFVKLHASRSLQLARPIKVNHKSWRQQKEEVVESEFQVGGSGDPLEYKLTAPNLKKEQQDEIAKARANEIASHERSLRVDCPGDVNIDVTGALILTGTQTAFDQEYIMSRVEHRFGFKGGYRMTISTRNASKSRGGAQQNK